MSPPGFSPAAALPVYFRSRLIPLLNCMAKYEKRAMTLTGAYRAFDAIMVARSIYGEQFQE
jgi:hypothetical protein